MCACMYVYLCRDMHVNMCVLCIVSSCSPGPYLCRMAFDDFKREFSDLEVCNITLDTFDEDENSECTPAQSCVTAGDQQAQYEHTVLSWPTRLCMLPVRPLVK